MSQDNEWRKHATEQLGSGSANRLGPGQTDGTAYSGRDNQDRASYRSMLAELYSKRPSFISFEGVDYKLMAVGHTGTVSQEYAIATPPRPVVGSVSLRELVHMNDAKLLPVGVAFLDRAPSEEHKFNIKRYMAKELAHVTWFCDDPKLMFTPNNIVRNLVELLDLELDHLYKPPAKPTKYETEVVSEGWHGIGRKTKTVKVEHPEPPRNYPEVVGADVYFYVATKDEPRIESGRPAPGIKVTSPGSGIMVITPADLATQ